MSNLSLYLSSTRVRVYLLWAVLTGVGFMATHFYQVPAINGLWTLLSIIGLGYMYHVMPLKINQMKRIYQSWLIPIIVGMVVSVLAVRTGIYPSLAGYLGVFWLAVMAIGYVWNGYADKPLFWYMFAGILNIVAAIVILLFDSLLSVQYLIAAIVSIWSMLNLAIYRQG